MPTGSTSTDITDFRQRLTDQLARDGFADVSFVHAATVIKGGRELGVFLCTATKL